MMQKIDVSFNAVLFIIYPIAFNKKGGTERGPDIVRLPYMGQKRTISGIRTISEGLDIPMVVMLFICYIMI